MSPAIIAIVLAAALLHAVWNAMVKGAVDRTVMLGLISLGHVIPGLVLVALAPAPALAALPYVIASTMIHWAYYFFLNAGYRTGDLSLVYPVARGLAPVMIALGAVIWADEYLPFLAWTGILTVSAGILMLVFRPQGAQGGALGAALATSAMIAAYSIVDGIGIRVSGSPLGYIGWLFVAEISVVAFVIALRRRAVGTMGQRALMLGFAGGVLSGLAYGLVLYAKTLAPLGIVSALRETSVIFAALIGVIWMGEGPVTRRLIAAAVVAFGIIVLSVA